MISSFYQIGTPEKGENKKFRGKTVNGGKLEMDNKTAMQVTTILEYINIAVVVFCSCICIRKDYIDKVELKSMY